ncbi:MAG: carbamoyltransferase [Anaerolineales bacterium]
MYVLGVSCYYHDAAAALLHDGLLVAAAEEERFSRKKHDYAFPEHAIRFCLEQVGIAGSDVDYVVFYEKPLVKFERILTTTLGTYPKGWRVFREAMISWFNEKLWIKGQLMSQLRVPANRVLFVDHHVSHAASAFFCSPFEEAALLTVDGVGEWTTAALGRGTADWTGGGSSSVSLDSEIRFPHSIGLLYSAFTAFLGFRVNSGEYKVMGMAPYGEPKYRDRVEQVVRLEADGSFRLNMDYFEFTHSTEQTFSRKFIDLLGAPRTPEAEFFTALTHPKRDHPDWSDAVAQRNQYYADVAASIQRTTEEMLLRMANEAHQRTGLSKLCMAGGVALNSVANGRILQETPFEEVFIQPAAGDSGGALGAALYAYHVLLGQPRKFVMEHAYWGKAYGEDEIERVLREQGLKYEHLSDDALTDRVVDALQREQVVALYQGRFEWGPRALGNRSILADPRSAAMKEVVNTKIKFREPFRPFAPVVLEDRAANYFELAQPERHFPARYMLMVKRFRDGKGEQVGAVNHMGTGRLQTVRREWNPRYFDIVHKFGDATGVPIVLNTSFNLRGEPIVTTPANALWTFTNSGIDRLVLENFLVSKEQ